MANPEELEYELVPRMRIDFNLLPVNGQVTYDHSSIESFITLTINQLVGNGNGNYDRIYVHLHQTHPPISTGFERFDKHEKQLNQLKYGDPGFFFVRDLTFVDRFPGNDWDQRFYNARQFIIQELHCKLCNGQLLLTRLLPSEDALCLINLISEGSTPVLILKDLPFQLFADEPSTLKLRNFFHSLGLPMDFRISSRNVSIQSKDNEECCKPSNFKLHCFFHKLDQLRDYMSSKNVSIQFEDYEECCKAIKKLCSHSLKKNGNSSIIVDYELSIEDSLEFNTSQDIDNGYSGSPTSQALNSGMAMLEKELKTVEALVEKNVGGSYYHPVIIHVLKHRVAMLIKKISSLKPLIARLGVGGNELSPRVHDVANLEEELNTLKAVLEESSVFYTETPATQALKRQIEKLELRVTMLEGENKRMKTST